MSVALAAGLIAPLAAQEPVPIPPTPTCPDCRILLEPEVTIGDRDGEGLLGDSPRPFRAPDGRYLVNSFPERYRLQVFDRRGRHITGLGRRGDGPGEWNFVNRVHFGETAVYVRSGYSVHMLDQELEWVRSFRTPISRVSGSLIYGDSLLVYTHASVPVPELIGILYHVLDMEGNLVRSFGEHDGPVTPFSEEMQVRRLAQARDDSFFAVGNIRDRTYIVERWGLSGDRLGVWSRRGEAFQPVPRSQAVPGEPAPPPAGLSAAGVDREGLLWVFTLVPRLPWRGWDAVEPYGAHDTIIDVIDLDAGVLVASERVERYLSPVWFDEHPPMAVTHRQDEVGYVFLDVWRLQLVR